MGRIKLLGKLLFVIGLVYSSIMFFLMMMINDLNQDFVLMFFIIFLVMILGMSLWIVCEDKK